MCGDDNSMTRGIVLRSARPPKYLQHVQDAYIDHASPFGVVQLRAFDNDRVGREVDAPSQRGRAAEHLNEALLEQHLRYRSVGPQHACVVYSHAEPKEFLYLHVL